jgi:hypothetical protein
MKFGSLNLLEPSGMSRPVTGLLYLYLYMAMLFDVTHKLLCLEKLIVVQVSVRE